MLRLHLYCDKLEVCNPVGKAKSEHKLLCFYYILGNVNARYWSSLRNINLVCLIKSSVAKHYSFCLLLQNLKQDLLVLERNGLCVTLLDGYSRVFQGSVATISADNLGSHEVGGFRRCFSSGPICRYCLCSYADLSSKVHESASTLRNSMTHQYHVKSFHWINHLDVLNHEFYIKFVELITVNPTPKVHYLLHYPRLLLHFGPLKRLWCMRFQAFHQKLKKIPAKSHNFKNVVHTIAYRLQYYKFGEHSEPFVLSAFPESKCQRELICALYHVLHRASLNTKGQSMCEKLLLLKS